MLSRAFGLIRKLLLAQSDFGVFGRLGARLAVIGVPPYKARESLAFLNERGYVSHRAEIYHGDLALGRNVFIGDRVCIYQVRNAKSPGVNGGAVQIGDRVALYSDIHIETAYGGRVVLGESTHVQPRCSFAGVIGSVIIGAKVEIASGCAFYPYNHGVALGRAIMDQPCFSKGDIIIGDEAWLGFGVVVLDGVKIGAGAVVGAGSVVTRDVPAFAIAAGAPAKVIGVRH